MLKFVIVFVLFLFGVPTVYAFDMGGSIRVRYETKQDFNFDDSKQDYWLSQIRVHLKDKVSDRFGYHIEFQDARVFGDDDNEFPAINEEAVPNIFVDEFDLHRAFITTEVGGAKVKVGRQKLNLGDMRLVASLEWVNTARVHDGVRLSWNKKDKSSVDVFATRLVPVDPNDSNDWGSVNNRYFDSQFHGVYGTQSFSNDEALHYWYFYRGNDRGSFDDQIHTVGVRYYRTVQGIKVDLQGAYQFGDWSAGGDTLDHAAYMYHLEASKAFKMGTFSVAYNYASGDDDASDDEHGTFDNLYPLNHAYYGYMDFFSLQNMKNLELVYKNKLAVGNLRVAYQTFWLAEAKTDSWYRANNSGRPITCTDCDDHVGNELDVTLGRAYMDGKLKVAGGLGMFFVGDYVEGNDQDAKFLFVQGKYSF